MGASGSSLNNISISGHSGAVGSQSAWTASLTDFGLSGSDANVKKYEVFEITEDLLVLSTTWQRMRKERDAGNQAGLMLMPSSITDNILFKNITVDDRDRAEQIRDYYHKKLMLWALNEINLSPFRHDMKKFIQSDGKVFQEGMKPLVYRLPEFYDYDVAFDDLFLAHNTKVNQDKPHLVKEKRLTLVSTIMRKRKHLTVKEYWFTDENDNLNLMVVNKDNSLLKLMDFYSQNPFKISGIFSKKIRDNREYCVLEKYSFL